jgi:hypothetical protein
MDFAAINALLSRCSAEIEAIRVTLSSHPLLSLKTGDLTNELVSLIATITHLNQALTNDEMKMRQEIENKLILLTHDLNEVKAFLQVANKTLANNGEPSSSGNIEVEVSTEVEYTKRTGLIRNENPVGTIQLPENQSLSSKVCKLAENSLREPPSKFDSKAV